MPLISSGVKPTHRGRGSEISRASTAFIKGQLKKMIAKIQVHIQLEDTRCDSPSISGEQSGGLQSTIVLALVVLRAGQ